MGMFLYMPHYSTPGIPTAACTFVYSRIHSSVTLTDLGSTLHRLGMDFIVTNGKSTFVTRASFLGDISPLKDKVNRLMSLERQRYDTPGIRGFTNRY